MGSPIRLSREAPGVPIVEVGDTIEIEGCAAVGYRQIIALGAQANLVPTGLPSVKSRLYASQGGVSREVARWDTRWPLQSAQNAGTLLAASESDALLYYQYRPGRPAAGILQTLRTYRGLRVGDVQDPRYFVGALDVVKVSQEDAWRLLQIPHSEMTPQAALRVARAISETYGFSTAILTLGPLGFAAHTTEGAILGSAIPGGLRPAGAGDIFSGILVTHLAAGGEMREALRVANIGASLASRKEGHLATIGVRELAEWTESESTLSGTATESATGNS